MQRIVPLREEGFNFILVLTVLTFSYYTEIFNKMPKGEALLPHRYPCSSPWGGSLRLLCLYDDRPYRLVLPVTWEAVTR